MIGIQGIRLDAVSIERKEDNQDSITAKYALLSTNGKVLAKQGVNGYNDIVVPMGGDTLKKLNEFIKSYKQDIEEVLGLKGEE